MRLSDLKKYHNIVIQCHDIPDADTIASGYALYRYVKLADIPVRLVYSGRSKIAKINLKLMVDLLNIPLEYVEPGMECEELLLTVDCQYGASQVTELKAPIKAIIDHHQKDRHLANHTFEFMHIYDSYGSCASVIYQLLLLHTLDPNTPQIEKNLIKDSKIGTALIYGLYMDTNEFSELSHPADKDLRSNVLYDSAIFTSLKSSNFERRELEIISNCLKSVSYNPEYKLAISCAENCDPNILGFVSDMCNHTDQINCCVIYLKLPNIYKISVRCCTKEVRANELAAALTRNVGNGGGHIQKAGGAIQIDLYNEQNPNTDIQSFITKRYLDFYTGSDYIYANKYEINEHLNEFSKYKKKKLVLGYIPTEIFANFASEIKVSTLEGNVQVKISPETFLMFGIKGEMYPITKQKFEKTYIASNSSETDITFDYEPRIYNAATNELKFVREQIIPCRVDAENVIYVKKLNKVTKLFTQWNYENYMTGLEGDYLAVSNNTDHDMYIISSEIFNLIYEKV